MFSTEQVVIGCHCDTGVSATACESEPSNSSVCDCCRKVLRNVNQTHHSFQAFCTKMPFFFHIPSFRNFGRRFCFGSNCAPGKKSRERHLPKKPELKATGEPGTCWYEYINLIISYVYIYIISTCDMAWIDKDSG